MKLRKLNGNDIFKASRILKKMDFKMNMEEIKQFMEKENKEDQNIENAQMAAGLEVFKRILENLYLVQDEVNDFLGSLCGCSGEEFGEKDLDEVAEVMIAFKGMVKESNFLKHLSKLM